MRPKLPRSVVRRELFWQFQIRRCIPNAEKNTDASGLYGSFQETMVGTHVGAISKERLQSEADFSPAKGKLVLLEYSEERPPIQLTKGMSSKIVNYCRGDQAQCPGGPSAGHDGGKFDNRNNRLSRLEGPNRKTTVIDWVGKIPNESMKDNSENEGLDVLQEGVTEILHPKVHGPFLGEVEEGATITGLINNLFVAPMFRHKPKSSDFLLVLTPLGGAARHDDREKVGVILRDLPASIFTVGQTEPRKRVMAPGSQDEKAFIEQFVLYRIARALTLSGGRGLRLDEIQNRVLPSYDLSEGTLRRLLKQVAVFDRSLNIWTSKATGDSEDYPGDDALERAIAPELVAAFESSRAARQRLLDLGVCQLVDGGAKAVVSVGVVMSYLSAQLYALRKIAKMVEKLSKTHPSRCKPVQLKFYEKASEELAMQYKALKQKHAVAQFLYEELQLAPWHTTGDFLDVHKNRKGTGMVQLTGLGDPSGRGEGYSFLREAKSKPKTSTETTKKITGTDDDLRKLTMKQMAALLREYGMAKTQIGTLKRWERVEAIRKLSTKAASDGIGGGLERYARGPKMNLSEQRQTYVERIRVIWKRQIAALSVSGDVATETNTGSEAPLSKTTDSDKDDSGSDSEDDEFEATLEFEMTGRTEAYRLVAEHACGGESGGELSQILAATQDRALTEEALELAALRRELKEERLAKEGLKSNGSEDDSFSSSAVRGDRKVIRKRITTTHPDGQQTTKFQFIVHPGEVEKIMARLQQDPENSSLRPSLETKYEHSASEKPPGHAMFEDDDE